MTPIGAAPVSPLIPPDPALRPGGASPRPSPSEAIPGGRSGDRTAERADAAVERRFRRAPRTDTAAADRRPQPQAAAEQRSLFTEEGRTALDTGAGKPPFLASILFRVQQFAQEFLGGRKTSTPDEATQGTEAYHRAYRLGQTLFNPRSALEIAVLVPNGPVDITV